MVKKTRKAKVPTKRLLGWEDRLLEVVEKYRGTAFDWVGGVNCFFFAMDVVEALTGVDPYAEERGKIFSPEDATRRMAEKGLTGLEEAIEAEFRQVPISQAHRGDIGFIIWNGVLILVVFVNTGVVGLTEKGLKFLPRSQVYKAYKVGRV